MKGEAGMVAIGCFVGFMCGIMIGGSLGEYTTTDQMQKQAVSRGFAVYDMRTQDFRWKEAQLESERDQDR